MTTGRLEKREEEGRDPWQRLEAVEMRRLKRLHQIQTLRVLVKDGVLVVVVQQVVHLVKHTFAYQKFAAGCVDDLEVLVGRTLRFERD